MNRHIDPTTLHVVRTADNEVEVFSSADDAREFARHKRGATVLERTIRNSLRDAQIVYERRVQVTKGVVTHDATNDEPFFAVGADSWIRTAEVESFEARTTIGRSSDSAPSTRNSTPWWIGRSRGSCRPPSEKRAPSAAGSGVVRPFGGDGRWRATSA